MAPTLRSASRANSQAEKPPLPSKPATPARRKKKPATTRTGDASAWEALAQTPEVAKTGKAVKRHLGTPASVKGRRKRQPSATSTETQTRDTTDVSVHSTAPRRCDDSEAATGGRPACANEESRPTPPESPTKRGRRLAARQGRKRSQETPQNIKNCRSVSPLLSSPVSPSVAPPVQPSPSSPKTAERHSREEIESDSDDGLPRLLGRERLFRSSEDDDPEDDTMAEDLELIARLSQHTDAATLPLLDSHVTPLRPPTPSTAVVDTTTPRSHKEPVASPVANQRTFSSPLPSSHDRHDEETRSPMPSAVTPIATPVRMVVSTPSTSDTATDVDGAFQHTHPLPDPSDAFLNLPLPTSLALLLQQFSGLEEVIYQRRKRGYPLLFSIGGQNDVISLQKHAEQVTRRALPLDRVRQIAWLAPHLIGLQWALAMGPQDHRRIWDIEIQQRPFLREGPLIMHPLKEVVTLKRRAAFRAVCLRWLALRHTEFLRTNDPPLPLIPLENLSQWHPLFDIERDSLPVPKLTLPPRPTASRHPEQPGLFQLLLRSEKPFSTPPCEPTTTPSKHVTRSQGQTVAIPSPPSGEDHHADSPTTSQRCVKRAMTPPPPSYGDRGRQETTPQRYATPVRTATPVRYATPVRTATPVRYATPVRTATPVRSTTPVRANGSPSEAATPPRTPKAGRGTTPSQAIPNDLHSPFPRTADISAGQRRCFERAREREHAKTLEAMLHQELQGVGQEVERIEDARVCFDAITRLFLRTNRHPLTQLESLAPQVVEAVGTARPGLTSERVLEAITYLAEHTEGVMTLRESKLNATTKTLQFHRSNKIAGEKARLLDQLQDAKERAEVHKQQKLRELSQQLHREYASKADESSAF